MQRLRERDSAARHLRYARYHINFCRQRKGETLFDALVSEMEEKRKALIAQTRVVEDADEALTGTNADVSAAELVLEDGIRDVEADLSKLDRQSPELNIRQKVLPEGLSKVINLEREAQLIATEALVQRLSAFKEKPEVEGALSRLSPLLDKFRSALEARRQAETKVKEAEREERYARAQVREQFESAYGRLRDHFKARPKLAERYFLQDRGAERAESAADALISGRLQGRREALTQVLHALQLPPTPEVQKRIDETTDLAVLERWTAKAFTIPTVEDLFL